MALCMYVMTIPTLRDIPSSFGRDGGTTDFLHTAALGIPPLVSKLINVQNKSMTQPRWSLVANLGDVSPIEHGGAFVFVDTTGEHAPELEIWEEIEADGGAPALVQVSRITLEPHTYQNGALSDNPYHPDKPTWYARDLSGVASCVGMTTKELRGLLCSEDPIERANGYRALIDYFSLDNFDQYPRTLDRRAAICRLHEIGYWTEQQTDRELDALDEQEQRKILPFTKLRA